MGVGVSVAAVPHFAAEDHAGVARARCGARAVAPDRPGCRRLAAPQHLRSRPPRSAVPRLRADRPHASAIAILREELAVAERASATRAAATHGIIHGDLFRDNVLWDGEEIVAILDFEQASGGSLAYDLAVCINDWCWTGQPRLDLAADCSTAMGAITRYRGRSRRAGY
jgi:homoserine kinase type II